MTPAEAMARAQELVEAVHAGHTDPAVAAAEIHRLAAVVGTAEPAATGFRYLALLVDHLDTQQRRDLTGMEAVADRAAELRERLPAGSMLAVIAEVVEAAQRAVVAGARGNPAAVREQVERAAALRSGLPAGDPQADQVRRMIDEMVSQFGAVAQAGQHPSARAGDAPAPDVVLRRALDEAGDDTTRAMAHAQLAGWHMAQGERSGSPEHLDAAAREFERAADIVGDRDPRQVFYLCGRGGALTQLFDRSLDPGTLDRALAVLERARTLAGDAAHPQWSLLCSMLAQAHRLAGRPDVGARIGRDGLRGHAWSVLLQADPGAAADVARDAADDAVREARWSIGYGHNEAAVGALEAGRGLALQASTRLRDATDLLRLRGATDLARRWAQAVSRTGSDTVPVELRREIIAELDGPGPGRWAGPPEMAEIQAALLRLDTDALVYLVAGIPDPGPGNREGGFALVVPSRGRPSLLLLPDLIADPGGLLAGWARASTGRAVDLLDGRAVGARPDPGAAATWEADLERVCAWAWTAAMEPLLDTHLPRHHPFTRGRTPRLAVVAMGELGRVPWAAARRRTASGWVHAVDGAVVSTCVSARMLCAAAGAPRVRPTESALLVGDPDHGPAADGSRPVDLPDARLEALTLRRAFYRDGQYLGRRSRAAAGPSSTGTRAQVQAWLDDPEGGPLLHAACHGVVRDGRSRGNSSCLLLADGDEFGAEDLLRSLSSTGARRLDLVVLSACHTGVSGRGYDESLSLATAFLAGGVGTVISTQWAVPDAATSALMFLFHQRLHEGHAPVDALRAAQLWMLDPHRVAPDTMPRALYDKVPPDRPAALVSWAGFAHAGR